MKDKNNKFSYNIYSASEYDHSLTEFTPNEEIIISTSNEWAAIGNESIKITGTKSTSNGIRLYIYDFNIDDNINFECTLLNKSMESCRVSIISSNNGYYTELYWTRVYPSVKPQLIQLNAIPKQEFGAIIIRVWTYSGTIFIDNFNIN